MFKTKESKYAELDNVKCENELKFKILETCWIKRRKVYHFGLYHLARNTKVNKLRSDR